VGKFEMQRPARGGGGQNARSAESGPEISVKSNSMSIHPEIFENDTMPLQFLSNLEVIFVNMRHAKIQNFRLVSILYIYLIVFILSDFVVLGFSQKWAWFEQNFLGSGS
jgi:hypothetical protein